MLVVGDGWISQEIIIVVAMGEEEMREKKENDRLQIDPLCEGDFTGDQGHGGEDGGSGG